MSVTAKPKAFRPAEFSRKMKPFTVMIDAIDVTERRRLSRRCTAFRELFCTAALFAGITLAVLLIRAVSGDQSEASLEQRIFIVRHADKYSSYPACTGPTPKPTSDQYQTQIGPA